MSARNICPELALGWLRLLSPFLTEFLFPFLSHMNTGLLIRLIWKDTEICAIGRRGGEGKRETLSFATSFELSRKEIHFPEL